MLGLVHWSDDWDLYNRQQVGAAACGCTSARCQRWYVSREFHDVRDIARYARDENICPKCCAILDALAVAADVKDALR